jgi:hypothetical protein
MKIIILALFPRGLSPCPLGGGPYGPEGAMLTFQIGLHIDDLFILEYIKNKLNCGHISISGKKCNYFINDKDSLLQILLPIFNFTKLNSSKYHQFILFEKVVNFIKDKKHLPLLPLLH